MLQEVKSSERGQVLLIVILVIIVALTIGLSLASRGITNLSTSTEEANSQKALAAAEAQIEKALGNTVTGTFNGTFTPSTTYETEVTTQGNDDTFLLNGGSLITQGEGADVWFADHDAAGLIDYGTVISLSPNHFFLYWGVGSEPDCNSADPSTWPAAIEVIVVSGTSPLSITATRYAYDYCTARNNNFITADSDSESIGGTTLELRTPTGGNSIDITNAIFMRVVPVYKSAVIGVRACTVGGGVCTTLTSQGYQITSTGKAGTASRKLNVFKGYPQVFLPYISYGLFVPKKL